MHYVCRLVLLSIVLVHLVNVSVNASIIGDVSISPSRSVFKKRVFRPSIEPFLRDQNLVTKIQRSVQSTTPVPTTTTTRAPFTLPHIPEYGFHTERDITDFHNNFGEFFIGGKGITKSDHEFELITYPPLNYGQIQSHRFTKPKDKSNYRMDNQDDSSVNSISNSMDNTISNRNQVINRLDNAANRPTNRDYNRDYNQDYNRDYNREPDREHNRVINNDHQDQTMKHQNDPRAKKTHYRIGVIDQPTASLADNEVYPDPVIRFVEQYKCDLNSSTCGLKNDPQLRDMFFLEEIRDVNNRQRCFVADTSRAKWANMFGARLITRYFHTFAMPSACFELTFFANGPGIMDLTVAQQDSETEVIWRLRDPHYSAELSFEQIRRQKIDVKLKESDPRFFITVNLDPNRVCRIGILGFNFAYDRCANV